ncbi:hypothetical protein BDZ89DRAFT_1107158 [Hymenopellis radicata]|nr:hypothetical protein BDZ89DRAFT_1107158 [Hymenopellis radicata]
MSSESAELASIVDTVALVLQTLFYGIYILIMAFFTYKTLKAGLKSTTRRLIFSMILFMFTLSTASWASDLASFIQKIVDRFVRILPSDERAKLFHYNTLISAIILINYVLADGVVVWRAWVLCGQDSAYRWLLWIPISLLTCTTLSVLTTIVIRIVICIHTSADTDLETDINYSQTMTLVFSLLTNILATSIIGLKAWKHGQWIRKELKFARTKNSRGEKIMVLLIESGLFYCISGAAVLICSLIRMPHGTLGDIYTPVNVQIAGIYPIVVLLLVNHQNASGGSVFETSKTRQGEVIGNRELRSRFESLQFASQSEETTEA